MYCSNCGSEIRKGEKFCQNCGAPVAARQAAELSSALKAAQGFAGAAAVSAPAEELSDRPSLTRDFAVSAENFNLILGGTLLWGFVMNVLFCIFFSRAAVQLPYGAVLIVYAVLALAGILINIGSDKPIWSFVGYNLVVLPLGLVLSVLYVFFRDMQYLWSVFTLLLMYMSAIFYTTDALPTVLQELLLLNPVYVYITYIRTAVIGGTVPTAGMHLLCICYAALALIGGILVYRRCNDRLLYYV